MCAFRGCRHELITEAEHRTWGYLRKGDVQTYRDVDVLVIGDKASTRGDTRVKGAHFHALGVNGLPSSLPADRHTCGHGAIGLRIEQEPAQNTGTEMS